MVAATRSTLHIIALLSMALAALYGSERFVLFVQAPHSGVYGKFKPEGYVIRLLDNVNASVQLNRGAYVTAVNGVPIPERFDSLLRLNPVRKNAWEIDQTIDLKIRDGNLGEKSALLRLRPFSPLDLVGPFRIWFLGAFIVVFGCYFLYRYPSQSRVNVLGILMFASATSIFNYSGRHLTLDLGPRLPLFTGVQMLTLSVIFSLWLYLVLQLLHRRGRFHVSPALNWTIFVAPLLAAVFVFLLHKSPVSGFERVMRLLYAWAGGTMVLCFSILLHAFRSTDDGVLKAQLKWVLWGHMFGMSPYVLLYAIPAALTSTPLIPYWLALVPFPIIVFAYLFSFYRYRLMDVDEVIHGSVVYLTSAGILTLFYLWGIGLFHQFLGIFTGDQSAAGSDLIFILGLAFVFSPLKGLIQKGIDQTLFPERIELPGILLEGSAKVARSAHMDELMDFLLLDLPGRLGIESAAVALRSANGGQWEVCMRPEGWIAWDPEMRTALESLRERPLPPEEWALITFEEESPGQSPRAFMTSRGICGLFPLKSGDDLLGFYMLGKRSTNRLLNSEEARLIATISTQVAQRLGNARLLETLQRANRSLLDLSDRLMQTEQMANLGEGAAMLAHELKNPLGIIRASAEILERGKDPAKNEEVVRFIIDEADRLAEIVDEFIKFARMPLPSKTEVDLNDLVQSAVLLWESRRKTVARISTRFRLSADAGKVKLDPKQIYQVLLNLLSNAEEAMPHGGELVISTDVDIKSGQVRASVRDDGRGIEEQDLGRVFDRFFTTKESGLGLGLALVRKIVEAHGGAVQITSSPGTGTEVILKLPMDVSSMRETPIGRQ